MHSAPLLREWKRLSEEAALVAIENPKSVQSRQINDAEIVRFFAQCFDRPAFQDHFHVEGSMEAFDRAMEDTLTAINTGCLRSRDGAVLFQSWGKSFLTNAKWRQQMDVIADLLRAIRSRYVEAKRDGQIHVDERSDGTDSIASTTGRSEIGWTVLDIKFSSYWQKFVRKAEFLRLFFHDLTLADGDASRSRLGKGIASLVQSSLCNDRTCGVCSADYRTAEAPLQLRECQDAARGAENCDHGTAPSHAETMSQKAYPNPNGSLR